MSILLYGCITWILTKPIEKKLDGICTRMLRVILNKSWRQRPTKKHLYGHLPSISKTIKATRTRRAGHVWRSKDGIISDILLWTPSHGWAKAGQSARNYVYHLCANTGYSLEDLPGAMGYIDVWWERVRKILGGSPTWWWWSLKLDNFPPW